MNTSTSTIDRPGQLADSAAASADNAIHRTQRLANSALDNLADSANGLRSGMEPMIDRASVRVSELAHRGADAVRHRSQQLRESADAASARTRGYIVDEPVKAVLIAAAAGAAIVGLLSLFSQGRRRD